MYKSFNLSDILPQGSIPQKEFLICWRVVAFTVYYLLVETVRKHIVSRLQLLALVLRYGFLILAQDPIPQ